MSGRDQEMLHREQPPEGGSGGAMETVPDQQEFNRGGGGGGGPFMAFSIGSMSTSTRTECKPDPNDPSHQICKTITERRKLNPQTGKYDTFREEREITPPASRNFFSRANNSRPETLPVAQEPPRRSGAGGFFSNLKNNLTNWWNRPQGTAGFIGQQNQNYQAPAPQNYPVQQNTASFSREQAPVQSYTQQRGHPMDPFAEIEASFMSPFRRMGHPFFQDDPFQRMHRGSFFDHEDPISSFFADDPIFGAMHGHARNSREGGSGGFQGGFPAQNSQSSFFEQDFPVATYLQAPGGKIIHITPEAIKELRKEAEKMEKDEHSKFDRKHQTSQKKVEPVADVARTKHKSSPSDKIYDV